MGLARGDKWNLDEVVVKINGHKHWLWSAVDQHCATLDVLVSSRRDLHAARRLMRKLMKKHGRIPRVLVTDKLRNYAAANRDLGLDLDHRLHKGLNPGGEFAPADPNQREGHTSVQVGAASAALCIDPRSGGQLVHA